MMLRKTALSLFVVIITLTHPASAAGAGFTESYINLKDIATVYNNAEFLKCIREYKKLADNGDIEAYLNLAVIFKDLGHYSRAISILNKAHFKIGNELRLISLLGRLYYLNNQTDEAVVIFKKILELKPDDLDTYVNLGLCYQDKGNDLEAQKCFARAISLDKNNVVARISLADLYYRKDRLPEAANEYKTISLIDASIIRIQKSQAEIFFKMGNLEESLKAFRKIRFIDPKDKLAEQRIDEISSKLGKKYFDKEREKLALQRKQKKVLVKSFPKIKNIIFVRIGLIQGENSVEFKCSAPFEIKTKQDQLNIINGLEDQTHLISKSTDGKIVIANQNKESIIVDEPIVIKPLKPEGTITLFNIKLGQGNFWAGQLDRSYRGTIEITIDKSGMSVVNIVNLEEYLYSVVPSEMPAHWRREALKAQAVAARAEAMKKLGRHKNEEFDLCSEVHCQVYGGVEAETEATSQAVDETRGIIMAYDGRPIDALYSSNCGGHTQENIFGKRERVPYLEARLDTLKKKEINFPLSAIELEYWLKAPPEGILCDVQQNPSNFRWVRIYTANEINQMLNRIGDIGAVNKLIVIKRQESGHINAIKVVGEGFSYVLEKELDIRKTLGNLRSSMFKIEVKYGPDKKPEKFIFYGGGFGHGVGMCQSGAFGLADNGRVYKEILRHYYREVEFKKIY